MKHGLTIIGFSGKAETGKDYLAREYARPVGFYPVALADSIKEWAVAQGKCTFEEAFVTKPKWVRDLLQRMGTEEGRDVYGVNVWCLKTLTRMRRVAETWGITKFAVTDVRFENEVLFIQENDGMVFRTFAPDRVEQSKLTKEQRRHVSETALDRYDPIYVPGQRPRYDHCGVFDVVIDNRIGPEIDVPYQMTHAFIVYDLIKPTEKLIPGIGAVPNEHAVWTEIDLTQATLEKMAGESVPTDAEGPESLEPPSKMDGV